MVSPRMEAQGYNNYKFYHSAGKRDRDLSERSEGAVKANERSEWADVVSDKVSRPVCVNPDFQGARSRP